MTNLASELDFAENDSPVGESFDADNFEHHIERGIRSAKRVLAAVLKSYQVASVLDIGCGIGIWLCAARELGIGDITGLDGDGIDGTALLFDPRRLHVSNLSQPFCLPRPFDLTICNEVAEHFPHERGPTLVRDIAATSDVILFSAAIPFQGGDNHFNEQWPEYWAILFRRHGFICFDPFRDLIWDDAEVESWYAQNVLLYVKEGHELETKLKRYRADRRALSRVHPKIFLTNVTRHRPLASSALEAEIRDWDQLVEAYISGSIEVPSLGAVMDVQAGQGDTGQFPLSRMQYSDASEIERQHSETTRQLTEERDHLALKVTVLDTHAKALESINIQLTTESGYKTAQAELLRNDRDRLQSVVTEQGTQSELLRKERDQHAAQSESFRHDRDRLQNVVEEQATQSELLRKERDQHAARSESFRQDRDRLQNVVEEQVTQSESILRERDQCAAEVELLWRDGEQLRNIIAEHAAVTEAFREDRDRHASRSELLRRDRNRLQKVVTEQVAQAGLLRQERDQQAAQFESLRLDRDRLQNVVTEQAAHAGLLRHERNHLQRALADNSAELELLRQHLNGLLVSTSWQITRPARAVLRRMPTLARPLRRALKLAWWTVSLQLVARLRERGKRRLPEVPVDQGAAIVQPVSLPDPSPIVAVAPLPTSTASIEMEVDNLEALGAFNGGWYGAEPLFVEDRYSPVHVPSERHRQLANERYDAQSRGIVDKYYGGVVPGGDMPHFIRFGPTEMARAAVDNRWPRPDVSRSDVRPTYSVVTSYFKHAEFFRRCATSVAALMDSDFSASGEKRIEWVIVNDDPGIDEAGLRALMPESIRDVAIVISDAHGAKNRGVVPPLNDAIRAASNQWLLLLDCDDRIAANATLVLDHYIQKFSSCRYISSGMIDIDENDQSIRWRRHDHRPAAMVEVGMVAGHLKAIRRDLFEAIGEFNVDFPGCQDFDFALRTSLAEPILLIPDYLYYYRWHQHSQSVDKIEQLFRVFNTIRKIHLRRLIDQRWPSPAPAPSRKPARDLMRGICFIRTQGRRLNLLAETVQSITDQVVPVVPCIIVHGDRKSYDLVASWVAGLTPGPILLHASDPGRRRGYPLNVGLDYLERHADEFDFMCVLDDDDILYPFFSERLTAALAISGCDVAYGLASQRKPWQPPKRCHMPLPTSCLAVTNFIPINAYIARTDVVIANGIRFPENLDYMEDWDFLLSLFEAGARIKFVPETVSEFRIIGDGNTEERRDPEHFKDCQKALVAHGEIVARKFGVGSFYRDLLEFDFDRRTPLESWEIGAMIGAQETYARLSSDA